MSYIHQRLASLLGISHPTQGLHRIVQAGVLLYLLLLPFGKSFIELGSWSATLAVFLLYACGFRDTNARRLGWPLALFPLFWAYLLLSAAHSVMPSTSWYNLKVNLHMGFGLFFAGLEFVRRGRDIRLPVYAMTICGFAQGLDGIWQAATHHDLVNGTPMTTGGRLTGSFSTYRVGNLMSLYVPVMAGAYTLLKRHMPRGRSLALTAALLLPPLFLLYGSKTRSAYVGFAIACIAAFFLLRRDWWKIALGVSLAGLAALPFAPGRFSIQGIMKDPRISELWPLAMDVFREWPVFGAGAGAYNAAFRTLGLAPATQGIDIPHPHNVYVQLLCETGIVGLLFFLLLTAVLLGIAIRTIKPESRKNAPGENTWWRLAALFAASYVGYLGTAISAHNFFRSWWLGTASLLLGIALGYCAASRRPDFAATDAATAPATSTQRTDA